MGAADTRNVKTWQRPWRLALLAGINERTAKSFWRSPLTDANAKDTKPSNSLLGGSTNHPRNLGRFPCGGLGVPNKLLGFVPDELNIGCLFVESTEVV